MKTIQVNIMFEYTRQCIFDERWPQFKPMVYQTSANASVAGMCIRPDLEFVATVATGGRVKFLSAV